MRTQRIACPACQRRERLLLAQWNRQRTGLAEMQGDDSEQIALAEAVRYCAWQIIVPLQAEQAVVYLYATLFNLHVETFFWLDRRMVLWDDQAAWSLLRDLFDMPLL